MTILDYWRILRRGWVFVVAGLVLGVGAALVSNVVLPRQYTSDLTIYVSGQASGDYAVAASELALTRILSYRELVTEDRVLEDVISRLSLAETPAELADQIVVSNDPETHLLKVAVTDPSPERAALLANTVAESFVWMVSDLDRPLGDSVPAVRAQVLKEALPPLIAILPRPRLNLALGALVGLILGAGGAFLHNALGRRVRSAEILQEILRVPTLATFATEPTVRGGPPLVFGDEQRRGREEARLLARNLMLIDLGRTRKAVVLTSAGPRAGTTTTAWNLAVALAAEGERVALIDADMRRSGVREIMRTDGVIGLSSVLSGQVPLDRAIRSWNGCLDVLTTGALPPNPTEFLGSEQMSQLVRELQQRYDVVLFDSPPLLGTEDAAVLTAKVDGALLVCRAHRTSSTELTAAGEALQAAGGRLLGTVMTFTARYQRHRSDPTYLPEPRLPESEEKLVSGGTGGGAASAPAIGQRVEQDPR